eukprot:m.181123 g.181123  ORF g.181123 m.181123 type:complete len:398 (+) comp18441_c0_seq15:415-1608(+)
MPTQCCSSELRPISAETSLHANETVTQHALCRLWPWNCLLEYFAEHHQFSVSLKRCKTVQPDSKSLERVPPVSQTRSIHQNTRPPRARLACSVPESNGDSNPDPANVVEYGEYGKGAIASVINITITYPANKVVFRQQLYGHGTVSTAMRLHREGFATLYRGVAMPMCHKALSTSLMFGTFDTYRRLIAQYSSYDAADTWGEGCGSKRRQVAVYAAAGGLSGMTEAAIMPFERVQTLMQNPHYHDLYHTTTHAFRDVLHRGPKELYRGHAAVLLRNGLSSAAFFAVRQPVKDAVVTSEMLLGLPVTSAWLDPVHNFISGAILGATLSTVFYPLNVVKVRAQRQVGGHHRTLWTLFSQIYAERQTIRGMYAGCSTNFVRSLMSWGIINAVYEALNGVL